jgi:hypothetical protein
MPNKTHYLVLMPDASFESVISVGMKTKRFRNKFYFYYYYLFLLFSSKHFSFFSVENCWLQGLLIWRKRHLGRQNIAKKVKCQKFEFFLTLFFFFFLGFEIFVGILCHVWLSLNVYNNVCKSDIISNSLFDHFASKPFRLAIFVCIKFIKLFYVFFLHLLVLKKWSNL